MFLDLSTFAPKGANWIELGASDDNLGALTSDLAGEGYFSIGLLPDESNTSKNKLLELYTLFKNSASTFIKDDNGTRVFWDYQSKSQNLVTEYVFDYFNKLGEENSMLVAVYPHQWHVLFEKSDSLGTYASSRGTLNLIKLDNNKKSFATVLPVNGIIPVLPMADAWSKDSAGDNAAQDTYKFLLEACDNVEDSSDKNCNIDKTNHIGPEQNTYTEGKGFLKYGELVQLADELYKFFLKKDKKKSDSALKYRNDILKVLEEKIEEWFLIKNVDSPFFTYNRQWGTFIGYPSGFGSSREINDHMFHYGYFIKAAAIVSRFDTAWREKWKDAINLLVHEIANDRRDNKGFEKIPTPFLRNFDVYEGRAWASGHANFADGNNEESSSESMNAFAGIALWGAETQNDSMRDLGIYLYTNAAQSVLYYHFDVFNRVFPSGYTSGMCTIVWGLKCDYSNFFIASNLWNHAIEYIPVTATSLYLGYYPDYVEKDYNRIKDEKFELEKQVTSIVASYLAFFNPSDAMNLWKDKNKANSETDGCDTKAHIQSFISSMGQLGQVNTKREWNPKVPTYARFSKSNDNTDVVYNPSDNPITVTFSNGQSKEIPPHTVATDKYEPIEVVPYSP